MSGYPPQQPQYGPPQGQYPPQQGYGYPPQQPQMYPQQQPQVVIVKEEKKERGCLTAWYVSTPPFQINVPSLV
ncbi:hypothetical protein HYFRA_00003019 [Hymenoscyphus fraxineus]|uniref:Uncharacterized protein n=1 Tax=Hymenoscyphus fraxineus TaxID=746836 RepID=A0A9N9KQB1_9HELO|nr:hypothetical protein HYFRA_00003019 [Hymenoscyphus fraxineus]